jgi:GNAT superfamily N-acetyltransferase
MRLGDVTRGAFTVSDNPGRLDPVAIHAYLVRSYWAEGIPLELVRRSLAGSLSVGLYHQDRQIGLARIITDRATFAYLCDVYVLEEYRGQGLGKWLMETVMTHPDLQGLRRFSLVTRTAQGLYSPLGFVPVANPGNHMEIVRPGLYLKTDRRTDGQTDSGATGDTVT